MAVIQGLFGLLRGIQFIVGGVLGIIIIIIGAVLFVPIRYALAGEKNEAYWVDVEVTWFAKAAYYHYAIHTDQRVTGIFRLFGKTLFRKEEQGDSEGQEEKNVPEKRVSDTEKGVEQKMIHSKVEDMEALSEPVHERHETAHELLEAKQEIHSDVVNMDQELKEQVVEKDSFGLKDIWKYSGKEGVWQQLQVLVKKFLKEILPNKIEGTIEFGTDDPANTGYILAVLGILSPYYGDDIKVKADFDHPLLKGSGRVKGSIQLWVLIKMIVVFAFTEPVWNLIKLYGKKRKDGN